ncbi:MAG: twin-arginine translocation signal domain-containing protein [Planctomycetota bacterium]|nr:twin-arginine translocation signal domain-containing protein [Planctomycetota bacterium]
MASHDDELEKNTDRKSEEFSVSRRDFIKTVGVTSLATSVLSRADAEAQIRRAESGLPVPEGPGYIPNTRDVAENLRNRGIVGYADRLRVQPGETIRFMASSELPSYRAEIVRLIHGDPNPDGPGIKEEVIATEANGDYPGKHQDLPFGSYVTVPIAKLSALQAALPSPPGSLRLR